MVKITRVGEPCRKCGQPVIRKGHPADWKPKKKSPYHYNWWLYCAPCKTEYFVETAIVWHDNPAGRRERERLTKQRTMQQTGTRDAFGYFPGRDG